MDNKEIKQYLLDLLADDKVTVNGVNIDHLNQDIDMANYLVRKEPTGHFEITISAFREHS